MKDLAPVIVSDWDLWTTKLSTAYPLEFCLYNCELKSIPLKKYVESLHVPTMLKLKVNKVKWQDDKTNSCGWFCIQFLDNRFHGIPFMNSSRFVDMSKDGEQSLKDEFKYI